MEIKSLGGNLIFSCSHTYFPTGNMLIETYIYGVKSYGMTNLALIVSDSYFNYPQYDFE